MAETAQEPDILRVAAAVLLGCITGVILFVIIALGIGAANDRLGMKIPIDLLVAENVFSAVLLAGLLVVCVGAFCWKVWTTSPTGETAGGDEGTG